MVTYIIIGIVSAVLALIAIVFAKACQVRERRIRDFRRRHVSTYILNRLTQQAFTKAVNIVMDLVERDSADIEVIYNNEIVFNGYRDYDDNGNDTPHFWYNKKVLDAHGIKY